jgi:hypothetical protein
VVEVYVGYLRRKIDQPYGQRALQTVRGAGYRLVGDGGAAQATAPPQVTGSAQPTGSARASGSAQAGGPAGPNGAAPARPGIAG